MGPFWGSNGVYRRFFNFRAHLSACEAFTPPSFTTSAEILTLKLASRRKLHTTENGRKDSNGTTRKRRRKKKKKKKQKKRNDNTKTKRNAHAPTCIIPDASANASTFKTWVAVKELNLSCHNMDIW